MTNKSYFLALNRIASVGPRTVKKLLTRWPNLADLFATPQAELIEAGLPERIAKLICHYNLDAIKADLYWEQQDHHYLLTWEDERYPKLLREIHDPPVVLYAKGDLTCLKQASIAIIGTRKPSATGTETARRFAAELARLKLTIVSGLALGIDGAAHSGCLDVHGQTIAVLGSGIDYIYPRKHQALAQKICQRGLLISEFPLKTPPIAGHFPRRNRIISGLSLCILVVESAIRSGSLITARLALEQNRDVLAIPGSIHNPQAQGCHYLLQQGAKLITAVDDVLEEMGINKQGDQLAEVCVTLADTNNLVHSIGYEVTTIDQIANRSGLEVNQVACQLASLELAGEIQSVAGGYIRCLR